MPFQELFNQIEKLRPQMVNTLMRLIRIPAIGPENGGDGELKKAELLKEILQDLGFHDIDQYEAEDQRVPSGKRPNLIAYYRGKADSPKLWIVTHLDVVPAEENQWTITKPFEPTLKDGKVYGRGTSDNGQSMVSSIFAIQALKQLAIKPKRTVALAFVADEEHGSNHGIQNLIKKNLFSKRDLVIVPDSGEPNGAFIEVSEKSILWFKVVTKGKQTHASIPNTGLNAHRVGMQFSLALDDLLHKKYNKKDKHFNVPISTFEPTRKDKNVEAVNIVPGEDVVYFDCRILPQYDIKEVLSDIKETAEAFEQKSGATISTEIIQTQQAPAAVDAKSEVVTLLKKAIKTARGLDAKVGGIGGGTCAAFFRKAGIPAVVWSTVEEVAHQPDEYSKVQNMVDDAKVFAVLSVM
ncbi:MAG: M20 family metallo-hydrolase [Candidatus Bathyarchaeota archaeon]|nr:M20 family metallo-hydrolase [Candidatus Bathyarchaeota archaeon]